MKKLFIILLFSLPLISLGQATNWPYAYLRFKYGNVDVMIKADSAGKVIFDSSTPFLFNNKINIPKNTAIGANTDSVLTTTPVTGEIKKIRPAVPYTGATDSVNLNGQILSNIGLTDHNSDTSDIKIVVENTNNKHLQKTDNKQYLNEYVLIERKDAVNSSSVDFALPTGYKNFKVIFDNVVVSATNIRQLVMQQGTGSIVWDTTNYIKTYLAYLTNESTGAASANNYGSKTGVGVDIVTFHTVDVSILQANGEVKIFNPSNSSLSHTYNVNSNESLTITSTGINNYLFLNGTAKALGTTAVTNIRFVCYSSAGRILIDSGTFSLYGIK
jgi:hypothetical protein